MTSLRSRPLFTAFWAYLAQSPLTLGTHSTPLRLATSQGVTRCYSPHYPGGGHGSPLQCSCLGNPMAQGPGGLLTGPQSQAMPEQLGPAHSSEPPLPVTCARHLMGFPLCVAKCNNKPLKRNLLKKSNNLD